MIPFLLVSVSVGLIAYGAISVIEERFTSRRRMALAMGDRIPNTSSVAVNRDKLLAKITEEQQQLLAKRKPVRELIVKAGLETSAQRIQLMTVLFSVVAGAVVMGLTFLPIVAVLTSVFCFFIVPRLVLSILISRREAAFLDGFPDALDMISRGLKAGMPLASCLNQISESAAEPLRSEFAYVLDLQKLGIPIADAIKKMPDRVDLLDVRFFSIVVEIQQKTGGNLSEIIENISAVIRGRKEMRAKIKALISEAKVSSIIVGIIPLFFAVLSWYSDPEGFSKFWTETIGQIMLGVCLFLYLAGMGIFAFLVKPGS